MFKLKKDSDGKLLKYKARLVVKGFGQKKGIDFDEIFLSSCENVFYQSCFEFDC